MKKQNQRLIKKFMAGEKCYIYDVWTNEILEVDPVVYDLLAVDDSQTAVESRYGIREAGRARREIAQAEKAGYFSSDHVKIINFSVENLRSIEKELKTLGPDHLILNITEQCNLRCRYCAFSGNYLHSRIHSHHKMSESVLRQALDWYSGYQDRESFSIGFYGGEPLLDWPLLTTAVRLALEKINKPTKFRLTTNATLLDDQKIRFLIDHDFRLLVSLDGPKEVHDRYRVDRTGAGSFDRVWKAIERIREIDSEYYGRNVHFNLVLASPLELIKINEFMDQNPGFFQGHIISTSRVNPYPSCLPEVLTSAADPSLPEQRDYLFRIFEQKILNEAQIHPESLSEVVFKNDFIDMQQRAMLRMDETVASHGQCAPGRPKLFIGTDGRFHMCERVGEGRPLGDVYKGYDWPEIKLFLEQYNSFFQEECTSCWAIRFCHKCFVHVRYENRFSTKRREEFCRTVRDRWEWVLVNYSKIRQKRDDAFTWCREYV